MGLFSGKKKTHVNTSVSRMVADEDIIPSNKMAIMDYTFSGASSSVRVTDESITDFILKATTNNIVARSRKARTYAKKPDYAFGLPESNLVSRADVDVLAAVQESLERTYPEGVIVHDAYFGPMNNFYFLRPLLNQKYGYDFNSNELVEESRRIGFPCYMETAVIKYSKYSEDALIDPDTLKQVGPSAQSGYTPFRPADPKAPQVEWINNNDLDYDIAEVTVVYKDALGNKQTYPLIINYLAYEPSSKPIEDGLDDSDTNNIESEAVAPTVEDNLMNADYYQANYSYTEGGISKVGVFTYLYGMGLDSRLDNLFQVADKFGSYIPRMYARMNGRKSNNDSQIDTPEYKSMVGLARQLGFNWSNWVDEIHKSVGSVGDVVQIFMTYSLPANTKDKLIQEYMYEYFFGLYGRIPDKFATSSFKNLKDEMISYGSKQGQSIEIKDKAYTSQLSFSSIGYMDKAGSIGKVGSVDSGIFTDEVRVGRPVTGIFYKPISKVTCHWYRKQLTATTYREVRVYGLMTTEQVRGGYSTTAAGDSENLLIPLDLAVEHQFNNRKKEELYTKSMYIVLNTLKVVKQKWYQTGVFKAIMFIVAVVVSYLFPPAGVALQGWMAVAYAVVQSVVIGLVIQVAVKLLVSLGVNVGVVAGVVAIVALMYGGFTALTKTTGMAGITTVQLMQVSSQAFSMSNQGYALQTQNAIKDFMSTIAEMTDEQKDIERLAKDFAMGNHGPLLIHESPIQVGIRIGESPDDYYDRSIRITNLASAVYLYTETNVDMNLALPTHTQILNQMQENLDGLSLPRL